MKKLQKIFALLFFSFSLIWISCGKDSTNGPSTMELITSSPWKFSRATANGLDVSAFVDQCIKDNLLTFTVATPNNTGNMNEGASKCNAADPQQVEFTWTFDESFQKMAITSVGGGAIPLLPGGGNEFTLVSVNQTQMVLSQTVTFAGTSQAVQVVLVH
jgi:hypothetical protein